MSNLFDVSSLHQEELQRVSQLMERQPLSNPMHKPPKTVPAISPQVLSLAGLDVPYDHLEQRRPSLCTFRHRHPDHAHKRVEEVAPPHFRMAQPMTAAT